MGGCYDRDYNYAQARVQKTVKNPMSSFKVEFRDFLKTGEKTTLIEAYQELINQGQEKGFIKTIHDCVGISEATKEMLGYEIEAKYMIDLVPKKKGVGTITIESLLDAFDFPPTKGCQFLKDPVNALSKGINHFYGTEDGEERLVIIEKGGQTYKKEKGNCEPYAYGLPAEQFILKRSETRIPTSPQEVASAMLRLNQDGKMKYVGSVEKTKGDFFAINVMSGREYGLTVSDAAKLPDKKDRQLQLEIEYAGFVPGFPNINVNDEKELVCEMAHLYTSLFLAYGTNEVAVNKNFSMKIRPTVERKFDFASGQLEDKVVQMLPRKLELGKVRI